MTIKIKNTFTRQIIKTVIYFNRSAKRKSYKLMDNEFYCKEITAKSLNPRQKALIPAIPVSGL